MYPYVKRCIDILGAGVGLILLSPLLAGVVLAVRIQMGSPVFFKQLRPGLNARTFKIIKFRTMRHPKPGEILCLTDAERVTRLGNLLRRTSLDELPELFNVLKGEMSLVGPRPLLSAHLKIYTPEQARRLNVKPGITGWAQVNGRQNITFSKRFEYDVWYVDNMSFLLDLKIIIKTISKVFEREGINTGQSLEEVDDVGLLICACQEDE